jgi:hypothetical protein
MRKLLILQEDKPVAFVLLGVLALDVLALLLVLVQ